jgi:transmembrane sensor
MDQRLADGSLVEFNQGAEIAVDFSPELRNVDLLKGEAHFEVTRDTSRPFVVTAGRVRVRAVGTAFAVRFDAEAVEVLVTEGRVSVDDGTSRKETVPPAEVAAGFKVVVSSTRDETQVEVRPMTDFDFGERLAWRGRRLEFSGTPLRDAIMRFNTRNRVQLLIGDPSIEDLLVSGIFRADNVEGFVRLMEGSFGVRAERRTAYEIVLHQAPL